MEETREMEEDVLEEWEKRLARDLKRTRKRSGLVRATWRWRGRGRGEGVGRKRRCVVVDENGERVDLEEKARKMDDSDKEEENMEHAKNQKYDQEEVFYNAFIL